MEKAAPGAGAEAKAEVRILLSKCHQLNGHLLEILNELKPADVKELLMDIRAFGLNLSQFEKWLAEGVNVDGMDEAAQKDVALSVDQKLLKAKLAAKGGSVRGPTEVKDDVVMSNIFVPTSELGSPPFVNGAKLKKHYTSAIARLEEIIESVNKFRKGRLARLFSSVNLRKKLEMAQMLLKNDAKILFRTHLAEKEQQTDWLLNRRKEIIRQKSIAGLPGASPAVASPRASIAAGPDAKLPGQDTTPKQPETPQTTQEPQASTPPPRKSAPPVPPKGRRGTDIGGAVAKPNLAASALAKKIDIEKMFWSGLKCGSQCSWKVFLARFKRVLGTPNMPSSEEKLIKHILDASDTGFVSELKYLELVRGFGPLKMIVPNIKRIFSKPWWHGYLQKDDAEHLLDGKPPGTFLCRMSASSVGSFALAVAANGGTIKHFLVESITHHPELPAGRGVYIKNSGKCLAFNDLCQLVASKEYSNVFLHPFTCDYIKEGFFFGALEREEANEVLSEEPAGSFLIRFASNKPHLAVSVQTASGTPTHRLLELHDGRYDKARHKTLKAAVATYPDLVRPAHNVRSELYPIVADLDMTGVIDSEIAPGRTIAPPASEDQPIQGQTTTTNYGDVADFQGCDSSDDEDDLYGMMGGSKPKKPAAYDDDVYGMYREDGGQQRETTTTNNYYGEYGKFELDMISRMQEEGEFDSDSD